MSPLPTIPSMPWMPTIPPGRTTGGGVVGPTNGIKLEAGSGYLLMESGEYMVQE